MVGNAEGVSRTDPRTVVAVQGEPPNWEPLLTAVGAQLAGWFMWMHEGTFADGSTVQAYKHRSTRRYLFLDDHGQAHDEVDVRMFVPISLSFAIGVAFAGWHRVGPPRADLVALEAVLVAARGDNERYG